MPSIKRWIDWAGGAVSINLDGHNYVSVRRRHTIKWKRLMVGATPLPWCPLCGSIVPPEVHKYKGERAMEIHERVCWELDEDIEEEDQTEDHLQLEERQDDGIPEQET